MSIEQYRAKFLLYPRAHGPVFHQVRGVWRDNRTLQCLLRGDADGAG
jgi:hypothetical protein